MTKLPGINGTGGHLMEDRILTPTFFIPEELPTNITVAGIGGMGCNFVENLAKSGSKGLNLYSMNTDLQALEGCIGSETVQIGKNRTQGKGAGGNPDIGRRSAEDDEDMLCELLAGAEIVFVVAGMGGGTGTGAAPVIARIARARKILVVGILTTPLKMEGEKRITRAKEGMAALAKEVDSLVVVSNEKMSEVLGQDNVSVLEVFRMADDLVFQGVRGLSNIIASRGYINLDLADAENVLKRKDKSTSHQALVGLGEFQGKDRAVKAAMMAINNPLLSEFKIEKAAALLVNVRGGPGMGYKEAWKAVSIVAERAGKDEQEIFIGIGVDKDLEGKIQVTVIASAEETKPKELAPDQHPAQPSRQLNLYGSDSSSWKYWNSPMVLGDRKLHNRPVQNPNANVGGTLVENWQIPAIVRRGKCRYANPEVQASELNNSSNGWESKIN